MLPLEVTFLLVVILWGLLGSVRGFSKEIGASIAIVLAMTGLRVFGPMFIGRFNAIAGKVMASLIIKAGSAPPAGTDAFCYTPTQEQFFFYTIAFGVIVYMGYQGQTFELPMQVGKTPSLIVGLFAGLANGYLVAGTLWWFLDKCAKYQVPALGINGAGTLSTMANTLIKVLPFNLVGEPALLLGLLFLLLILRIAK